MKKPEHVETPRSYEELVEFMKGAAGRVAEANGGDPKDGGFTGGYNHVPTEIWQAGLKAMNMVAFELGATGFQFSHAELCLIQSSRQIEGPFMLVKVDEMLFPQYNVMDKVEDFLTNDDTNQFLKEAAQEKLEENAERIQLQESDDAPDFGISLRVVEHWRKLAAWEKK